MERFLQQYKKVVVRGGTVIGILLVAAGIMGFEIGGQNAVTFFWDVFIPIDIGLLFVGGVLELLLKTKQKRQK